MNSNRKAVAALGLSLAMAAGALAPAAAQDAAQAVPLKFTEVSGLISNYCAACHDWAATPAAAIAAGVILPGKPDSSPLIRQVEAGRMPPEGDSPSRSETALLRAWIAAGAPLDAAPGAGGGAGPGTAEALSAASEPAPEGATATAAPKGFLGFPSKASFHRSAGWGSAGLLLAAGTVGAVRALGLQSEAHAYRDAQGIDDESQIGSLCAAEIQKVWKADQTLRWVHVGLLVSGESLYLADAATGISWIDPKRSPSLRSRLHRWAFFGHAALMVTEAVLGFVTTDALSRGDHELVSTLGVAHAAIGFAIPVVIGAAGLIETLPGPRLRPGSK
jgi:hypothetical protein